jgi:outer membrane protein assembly factor BamB
MNEWTRKIHLCALIATLGVALLLPAVVSGQTAENWTRWGGPGQDFKAPAEGIADSWGEYGPKRLWSRDLGDGYSTILVEDGRLYTMHRAGDQEAVICMDEASGETIWEHRYDHDAHPGHVTQYGVGPRATPLISGDRIYTIGVAGMMHSLKKENGEVVWAHNLWGDVFGGNKLQHGYASSPLDYKDTVITLVGGEGKSIVAFNKVDGSVAWQSMSYPNSYGSPQLLEVDGQEQLVVFMAQEIIGADPATGEELWRYETDNQAQQNISPAVLVDGQYLFISSVVSGSRGLKLTRGEEGKTQVEELWSSRKVRFFHVTSVNDGDWVYGSSGGGSPAFMSAVNVKTGEIPWRKRGFAKANAVYADGRVIVLDENGQLYLTTATPEDLVVHSEVELLDRVAWSAPTIVGNNMYVRDKTKVMAFDLSASQTAEAAMASEESMAEAESEVAQAEPDAPATEEIAPADVEDSEAIKILRKVDAAAKAVSGVRYKAVVEPAGAAVNFVSAAEGGGVFFGWTGQTVERSRMSVKTTQRGSSEPVEVTGGGDGDMFFLIDHLAKKAYVDFDPAVTGSSGNALGAVRMIEFVHPTPFSDEINADTAELQGTVEIGGVECHKIHVVYQGGQGESTWFVSTEDFLPRRRIRHFNTPQQGEGTLTITITDLEIDPEVDPELFSLKLPAGYEQIDDFAP